MSRMLEALKVLERRQPRMQEENPPPPQANRETAKNRAASPGETALEIPAEEFDELQTRLAEEPQPSARFETCMLPTVTDVADHYLDMAGEIGRQLASNYCNVVLFVSADRWVEPCFSMTHTAQAFARQSAGDVLLVDGDLQFGRLSRSVARPGPGMIEAMLGLAQWPDIIHPTNVARIDFVACGNGQVPTVERPNFGWGALRPLYRTVLIGLAGNSEPETMWLAARCDAVYFVLSRPHTRRGSASAAINALRACGANVAGSIVVND
jgi:Mrp family chromosome partitioning ATPase